MSDNEFSPYLVTLPGASSQRAIAAPLRDGASPRRAHPEEVKDHHRERNLARLGSPRAPGLRVERNRYSRGGLFKADPNEAHTLTAWKRGSGVEGTSVTVG